MKAKCRMPPYGALCMLCATQCPPPPCIPPDALVFDYENMLEPGFSVSSLRTTEKCAGSSNAELCNPACLSVHFYNSKVANKNTSDYEETKSTTFVIQLKRFSLMIAQLHKWTIGPFSLSPPIQFGLFPDLRATFN